MGGIRLGGFECGKVVAMVCFWSRDAAGPRLRRRPSHVYMKDGREGRDCFEKLKGEAGRDVCWGGGRGQRFYGVSPELCTFGRALRNSCGVSALVGRRDIMGPGGLTSARRSSCAVEHWKRMDRYLGGLPVKPAFRKFN